MADYSSCAGSWPGSPGRERQSGQAGRFSNRGASGSGDHIRSGSSHARTRARHPLQGLCGRTELDAAAPSSGTGVTRHVGYRL